MLWSSLSEANPEGGQVVAGSATINRTTPSRIDVIQQTGKAIIDWRSFNIDSGEHTNFQQPSASAVALNRVGGGVPSNISGLLTANGQLFLINPNGVVFGSGAHVNVGSLVATTADIRNEDFLAGRYRFDKASDNLDAGVINRGVIQVAEGGAVVLAAPWVRNEGLIQARLGQVALAGAKTFTLDFHGDGLLQFDVGSAVGERPRGADGMPVNALVSNPGVILADGGVVALTARAVGQILDRVINLDGVVQARAVNVKGGIITLSGGDEGIVGVSGTLDASGLEAGQVGGTVKLLGEKVGLFDGARVDASGSAGGGAVLVGGNFQGKGPEPNANRTYVDANARISADAIVEGDGGKVIIWANELTGFFGHISARGGSKSGDGGFVEVSGKNSLEFRGTVDLSAANGTAGTVLLDPEDIFIGGSGENISEAALEGLAADATVVLEATNNVTINQLGGNALDFAATTGSVTIRADADLNGLGNFTVTSADTQIATQGGNLTIEAANFTSTGSLDVVTRGGNIAINSRNGEIPFNLFLFPNSSSVSAAGGNITVEALNDVFLNGRPLNIASFGPSGGGAVAITSKNGVVDLGNVTSASTAGAGGKVIVTAAGNLSTGTITSRGFSLGGDVSLTSVNGAIATDFGTEGPPLNPIDSSSPNGAGGNITLSAATNLNVGGINASGKTSGGNITLRANEIDLEGGSGSVVSTGGSLLIEPASPQQNIVIGGPDNSENTGPTDIVLDLTFTDGTALLPLFRSVTIGQSGGQGNITVLAGGTFNGTPYTLLGFGVPTTFLSPGGSIVFNGPIQAPALTISGANISLRDVTTTGDQSYTGAVTLNNSYSTGGGNFAVTGSAALGSDTTITTNGGAIVLNGPVNATLNSNSPETLALNAATGNISLQGSAGNSLALGALTASGTNISLQDVTTTGDQSYTGAVTLNNSYSTGGGNFAVTGSAALGSDTTITTNGGAIVLNGPVNATLNSNSPETLALNAATGNISLQGSVGNSLALGALTASGTNISLQDVTTTGDQSYAGAVTLNGSYTTSVGNFAVTGSAALGSDTTITTNGGAIVLNGPVNATLNSNSPETLALNAATGNITVQSDVGNALALGALTASGANISLQDVTTTGDQSYIGAVTVNSIYNTGGGNFAVTGSAALGSTTAITTLNSIPGAVPDGDITFAGTIDGAQALTLQAGTGNVVFGGDVGVQTRLGSVSVQAAAGAAGAADITIGGRFVAGDVNFEYTGFLNSPPGSLDVTSLFVAPTASGARVFGTVAGASGPQAAPLVTGAFADPDFTINDCVIGIPCFSTLLLPPPAQPRTTPPEVGPGDPATFEPLDIPPVVVARPPEDTSLDDPTTTQFSNFGNEELWMGEDKSE
jgi:filamentous hemagglutinin family protein